LKGKVGDLLHGAAKHADDAAKLAEKQGAKALEKDAAKEAADAAARGGADAAKQKWNLGDHKSAQKWESQMKKRGWDAGQIDEAMRNGQRYSAPNNVNPRNTATRYAHPTTGRSVVVDDVTGEVLHVGGDGFRY
jgi:hypothetical protein